MGFFTCRCQYSIDDKNPPNSSEARFVLDNDEEAFFEAFTTQIADFMAAVANGKRAEWITSVLSEAWVDASDKDIIYTFLGDHIGENFGSLLECPACGRIYVQGKGDERGYLGFRPEPVVFDPVPTPELRTCGVKGFAVVGRLLASSLDGLSKRPERRAVGEDRAVLRAA